MNEQSTREIWKAVLGELQLQLPRPTFETWLKQTDGVAYDDHQFVVEAPTPFAVAWLERRMYNDAIAVLHYRARSRAIISLAALRPARPMTPPPGWVPAPHKYKPSSGVAYCAAPGTGRTIMN